MLQPRNETEDSLLSISKTCETPIKQSYTKSEETLEFKLIKQRKTFHFNPPISIDGSLRFQLVSLEVYTSLFNMNQEKIKIELYTDTFDEFSFTELTDEVEEILDISNITSEYLQDDIMGPCKNSTYRKLETEKRQTDGCIILIMGFARSPFRELESHLRIVVGLDEDDIKLILQQYD